MPPMFSSDFLTPGIPVLEKIVRPLVIYLFLLVAFRIFGRRQLGQLGPFDFIVLLTISNVVQNAMIGNDNSLSGGIIGATTIFVANLTVAYVSFKFPKLEVFFEGKPVTLIENGKINRKNMEHELLTDNDLFFALRHNGIDPDTELHTLKKVQLDSEGQIVILRQGGPVRVKAKPITDIG